jgi:hypothetical protein
MKKYAYFDAHSNDDGWPAPQDIERYFLAPPGQRWFPEGSDDGALLCFEGAEGTGHLARGVGGRVDIRLWLQGHPTLGVLLMWSKWDGKRKNDYWSKGDLRRLREYVRTAQGDQMPVGLYVPYQIGWKAVKEFIETNGALPTSIEWVADSDLPSNTFPDP